jgi:hypothetical protein
MARKYGRARFARGEGPSQDLDGQPKPAEDGEWHNQIVTVPITSIPERVEDGVEFSVQLDQVPAMARLALKEAGLPWGQRLVVWINQQRAGTITPKVPDLLDEGFPSDTSSPYIGWRDGSFYAPVALLKQGINTLQFSTEDELSSSSSSAGADTPLAIKDLVMQFGYPPPPPTADAAVSQPPTDSDATVPVTPAPSTSAPTQSASP